jgi:hypothetical protein
MNTCRKSLRLANDGLALSAENKTVAATADLQYKD